MSSASICGAETRDLPQNLDGENAWIPIVIVVGPSNAGKTTLSQPVAETVACSYVDLDAEADVHSVGWPQRGWSLVAAYARDEAWRLVDVRAGFQNQPDAVARLAPHRASMIAVMADPVVVHARHPGRDFGEFLQTEFREDRRTIYSLAARQLETTNDIQLDQNKLTRLIRELIGGS